MIFLTVSVSDVFVLQQFQVRLQLEVLLAEKSRLAQDNANLARENQSLIQQIGRASCRERVSSPV